MTTYFKFFARLLVYISFSNLFAQKNSININTEFHEHSPTLSDDGKTMIFQSNRDGGYNLYEAKLQSDGKWSTPKAINEISAKQFSLIGGPTLTHDGNELYFCAMLVGGLGDMDIYYSKKINGAWSSPINVGAPINSIGYDGFPSISADGKKMYFTRVGKSNNCFNIFVSERSASETWSPPIILPRDFTAGCGKAPHILSDGRTLIFCYKSDRGEGYDLYQSILSKDGIWGDLTLIEFANSNENITFGSISEVDELVYYTANGDIFFINALPDLISNKVEFHVSDAESKKGIKTIFVIRNTTSQNLVKTDSSNSEGNFHVVLIPGEKYNFEIYARGYEKQSLVLGFPSNEDYTKITKTIDLKPKKREVNLTVSDFNSSEGLEVDITITNLETGEEMTIHETLDRDGKYGLNLREGNTYNVEVTNSKTGRVYPTTQIIIPDKNFTSSPSDTNISITLLSTMGSKETLDASQVKSTNNESIKAKITEETKIEEETKIILKTIFFDFNSFSLSEKSKEELERIIQIIDKKPTIRLEVSAYTDNVGSDNFNQKLSEQRAQSILNYLTSKGFDIKSLKSIGFGESNPLSINTTEEGRAQNRRAEIKIIGK